MLGLLNILQKLSDTLLEMKLPTFSKKKTLILTTLAFAGLASGCGSASSTADSSSTDGEKKEIVLYSERSKELIEPTIEAFEAASGYDVKVQYNDSGVLAALIKTEGDKTPADVFYTKTPGPIGTLEKSGQLAELSDEILALTPETVSDKEGLWTGVTGRQRVVVYNSDTVDASDLPTSVYDLTDPKWKGQVGIAPDNGSFQDFVTAMREIDGEEKTAQWLKDMAANEAVTYPKNGPIVDAVGSGEVKVGLVNHYYNYQKLAESENHKGVNHQFDADDPGSFLMISPIAKIKASDNQEGADALITWLLEEEAQQYFVDETFEYPLADGITPNSELPEAAFFDVSDIDYQELGEGLETTQKLIDDADFD